MLLVTYESEYPLVKDDTNMELPLKFAVWPVLPFKWLIYYYFAMRTTTHNAEVRIIM